MKKMSVEDKLGTNVFHTDEVNSHIDVDKAYPDKEEIMKVVLACPAACYTYDNDTLSFSHLGCLECGTCRVISHGKVVKDWNYPDGTRGVFYRQG